MMQRLTIPTKDVRSIAKLIEYRKRKIVIAPVTSVTLRGLNWSGGTRYEYTFMNLQAALQGDESAVKTPEFSIAPPWDNPAEGAEIQLEPGQAIVSHGHFCGKAMTATIYVHPSDMPKNLEA